MEEQQAIAESKFRFCSSRVGLTYSQADDLNPLDIVTFLNHERKAEYVEVWREEHKNGGAHFHCFAERDTRWDTRSARFFDVAGHHPNVLQPRSVRAWLRYIRKNGNRVYPAASESLQGDGMSAADPIDLALAGDYDGAVRAARHDRRYLVHGAAIDANLRRLTERNDRARHGRDAFAVPSSFRDAIQQWEPERRCLFITGPSGVGKTQWALAHYPRYRRITSIADLRGKTFREGVIFDDCDDSLSKLGRSEIIQLIDTETDSVIRCLYGSFTIKADCPRIILSNDTPRGMWSIHALDEAVRRRLHHVEIDENECLY